MCIYFSQISPISKAYLTPKDQPHGLFALQVSKDIDLCVTQAVDIVVDSAQALFIHVSVSVVPLPHNQGSLDLNTLPYVGFTLVLFFLQKNKHVSLQSNALLQDIYVYHSSIRHKKVSQNLNSASFLCPHVGSYLLLPTSWVKWLLHLLQLKRKNRRERSKAASLLAV